MNMWSKNFVMMALSALIASGAGAEPGKSCKVTTPLAVQNYPGAKFIPNGNNLLLPAGKSIAAEGQALIISGQLLDKNCLPVPQAVVELWQVDPYGRWLLAGPDDLVTPSPAFAGAGRTYTDMDGRFEFTTAFPAAVGKRAPNVNLKIKTPGMKDFSTALYFENDNRNEDDVSYKKLATDSRGGITLRMKQAGSNLRGTTTIVLPEAALYRTY